MLREQLAMKTFGGLRGDVSAPPGLETTGWRYAASSQPRVHCFYLFTTIYILYAETCILERFQSDGMLLIPFSNDKYQPTSSVH